MFPKTAFVLGILAAVSRAAHADPATNELLEARQLAASCNFVGAIQKGTLGLAEAEKTWPAEHEGFLIFRQDLASWYNSRLEFAHAIENGRAALAIARRVRGPDSALAALASQNLAVALAGERHFDEAESLLDDTAKIIDRGEDVRARLSLAEARSQLAFERGQFQRGASYAEQAAELLKRGSIPAAESFQAWLRIADARRQMLQFGGAADALTAAAQIPTTSLHRSAAKRLLLTRGSLAYSRGDLTDALSLFEKAATLENDTCDPLVDADLAQQIGTVHLIRREIPEARASFNTQVQILDRLQLRRSPRFAEAMFGLAVAAGFAGEYDVSEELFSKTIAAFEDAYGGPTAAQAQTLFERAYMDVAAGRVNAAVNSARSAVSMLQNHVEQNPLDKAYGQAVLGRALQAAGQFVEAENNLRGALEQFEKVRGPQSYDLAPGLTSLAEMRITERRFSEAEPLLRRALDIQQRGGWTGALAVGLAHTRLASALAGDGKTAAALEESARAVAVLQQRLILGEQRPWADAEAERRRARDITEVDMALLAPSHIPLATDVSIDRLLRSGQLGASMRTGAAIAQMAGRLESRNDVLASLLRKREDLVAELRSLDERTLADLSSDEDPHLRELLTAREVEINGELRSLDHNLEQSFGDTALLIKSPLASLKEVQAVLKPDEALVAFFSASDATYTVVVTTHSAKAYRVPITRSQLDQKVRELRLALDPEAWPTRTPPPFPLGLAHDLYEKLLGPSENFLPTGSHLIVAPDGPLLSLPLSLLVTKVPTSTSTGAALYRDTRWLVQDHSIDVMPSVASLVALRRIAHQADTNGTFLGVGDPYFGNGSARRGASRGVDTKLFTTRLADPSIIRSLPPLPDTAVELRSMASSLGPRDSRLLLGAEATEGRIKSMDLRPYRVIAFATHGLIAGELQGYGEPGLVLSPPPRPSAEDDGLLAASEVAGLHLDADWVILSACSTASGDGEPAAEPLTGLARAFFYAGARALLVTNWSVDSEAAAALSSATLAGYSRGLRRGEALREAQLSMIQDHDGSHRTHPFFWASYMVVGVD